MAKKTKVRGKKGFVPPYTGLTDWKVPSENVVLSHYLAEHAKFFVISQGSDGAVFTGYAATEPLARRAAGLRTLHHLQERAEGRLEGQSEDERIAAETELRQALARHLALIEEAVQGHNGEFPASYSRDVLLVELRAARELVLKGAGKSHLSRWIASPLLFLSGAFAEGIIGIYAEQAYEMFTNLLAS